MANANTKRAFDRESHIMIVDDDQTLLKFFKIHLNKFFSKVVIAKNAKEALDIMKDKAVDLILSDLRMPKTDGLQLIKKLRAENAAIPVYLISGALITDEQMKMIQEIADGFLRKPFTVDEIQEFINDGMVKRELLKELSNVIPDNKNLLAVLKGKTKIESLVKGVDKERANEIMFKLAS